MNTIQYTFNGYTAQLSGCEYEQERISNLIRLKIQREQTKQIKFLLLIWFVNTFVICCATYMAIVNRNVVRGVVGWTLTSVACCGYINVILLSVIVRAHCWPKRVYSGKEFNLTWKRNFDCSSNMSQFGKIASN